MPDQASNLRELADHLGLSVATVSLALRNLGRISPRTVQRVQAAARQLDYRPDPSLAALSRRRRRTEAYGGNLIALVDFSATGLGLQTERVQAMVHADQTARRLGLAVRVFAFTREQELTEHLRLWYHQGYAGLILNDFLGFDPTSLTRQPWDAFSVIMKGTSDHEIPFHRITRNYFSDFRVAFHRAYQRGYRRIGAALFRHTPLNTDDLHRVAPVLAMQVEFPEAAPLPPLLCDHADEASFLAWFRQHRPDAVISFHLPPFAWIERAGYAIPRQLGFACLNTLPREPWARQVSGLWTDPANDYRAALQFMDLKIRQGDRGLPATPTSLHLNSVWWEGTSLPSRLG